MLAAGLLMFAQTSTAAAAPPSNDTEDAGVVVDVSQSDHSAGVLVGIGTRGNLQTVACGPGAVGFNAVAGTTNYVLAIDDQFDGGGNGGSLQISLNEAPPPPTVNIVIDRFGRVDARTRVAHLTGTYTCTDADFIDVFGEVSQTVGRFVIRGSSLSSTSARATALRTLGRPQCSPRTASSLAERR